MLEDCKLNMYQQYDVAVKTTSTKANTVLGAISRSTVSRSIEGIMPLYSILIRPLLEYSVQFGAPQFEKDINISREEMVEGLETKP